VLAHESALRALARVAKLERLASAGRPRGAALAVAGGVEIYVPLAGLVDVAAERERLSREVEKVARELDGVRGKLANESFVARAPEEIVTQQRDRAEALEERRALLARGLERLAEVEA
jgi:valyl-tRNA synthetase